MTSKQQIKKIKQPIAAPHKQHGNILIMFTVSLVALISMVSLALDGSHLLLNKGKLQNLLDTAALHAAKELDEGATHSEARLAAINIIQLNLAHGDHNELANAVDLTVVNSTSNQVTSQLKIEFSQRPDPFVVDNGITAKYVKISLSQLDLTNFLAGVMNFNKQISATALAGPSTGFDCFNGIVPLLACGEDVPPTPSTMFGLPKVGLQLLKVPANGQQVLGSGNFQLVSLNGSNSSSYIRSALAGESTGEHCFASGQTIHTVPGNKVGPTAQGLNTRMGAWSGPVNNIDHPRDAITCEGDKILLDGSGTIESGAAAKQYSYATYLQHKKNGATSCSSSNPTTGNIVALSPAQYNRRVMNILIGDCGNANNGTVPYLGAACYFLTQSVGHTGQDSYIIGEMIDNCSSQGIPSGVAQDSVGPHTIVLYHVPGSTDS